MLQHALWYAEHGFPVLPLHTVVNGVCSCGGKDCTGGSRGKHPRTQNGSSDATVDTKQVTEWWTMWPDANIGIRTGGNFCVLDVDDNEEAGKFGSEYLSRWESEMGNLPDTLLCLTGSGGRHYYFKLTGDSKVSNRTNMLGIDGETTGLDARGTGGYVVAPPSIHYSGNRYEWEASSDPHDGAVMANIPDELYQLMTDHGDREKFKMPDVLSEGMRNDTLFKAAASMRSSGFDEEAIYSAIKVENERRANGSLPDAELRTIAKSASRYDIGDAVRSAQEAAQAVEDADRHLDTLEGENAATLKQLGSDEVLRSIWSIPDAAERTRRLAELEEMARSAKVLKSWRKIAAAFQTEWVRQQNIAQGSHKLEFTGAPPLVSGKWTCDERGVRHVRTKENGDEVEDWACAHPIYIKAKLIDVDDRTEKVILTYSRDSKWREITVAKSMVSSRQSIVALADHAVMVNSENAKFLITYLADFESLNGDRIPQLRGVERLGWTDDMFVPYADDIHFSGELADQPVFNAITETGDYEKWLTHVSEIRQFNDVTRTIIASSFASPLVAMFDKNVFITHVWGGAGAGKTVALLAALSVWGDPRKLFRTFDSTRVGMERMAGLFHSIPLALDELQTIQSQSQKAFDQIIYQLCTGRGRSRGTKRSGGLDRVAEWSNCIITNGEQPLTSESSGGGAKLRAIEIYCPDRVKIINDGPYTADVVSENYGYAGRKFIERLSADGAKKYALSAYETFYKRANATGLLEEKQAYALAMLCTGDVLANMYVWDMPEADAILDTSPYAERLFADFTESVRGYGDGQTEADPISRAYEWVKSWTVSNMKRFTGDAYGESYGFVKGEHFESSSIYVFPNVFRSALSDAGFNPTKTIKGFGERGFIARDTAGKNTVTKRVDGRLVRCIELFAWGEEEAQVEFDEMSDDTEVPFPEK